MKKWDSRFPDAFVALGAEIGVGVEIGPGTVVHEKVRLGDRTRVGPMCTIGCEAETLGPTAVGDDSIIRSHAAIYGGCELGKFLEASHHVVIRDGTRAGENLRIGNFSDIEGQCTIGDFCRCHGYVHVGRGSTIGDFVWLYSLVTALNDPLPPSEIEEPVTIGSGAVVCVGATLMPGTHIGIGAFVCSGATAKGEVPAGAVIEGANGAVVNSVRRLVHLDSGLQHPWMNHFHRGFPESCHARLEALRREVLAQCREQGPPGAVR
jgi:UDP-3-O-[3-hydroxymyristoyl] glucosamine N-acyltransferase